MISFRRVANYIKALFDRKVQAEDMMREHRKALRLELAASKYFVEGAHKDQEARNKAHVDLQNLREKHNLQFGINWRKIYYQRETEASKLIKRQS